MSSPVVILTALATNIGRPLSAPTSAARRPGESRRDTKENDRVQGRALRMGRKKKHSSSRNDKYGSGQVRDHVEQFHQFGKPHHEISPLRAPGQTQQLFLSFTLALEKQRHISGNSNENFIRFNRYSRNRRLMIIKLTKRRRAQAHRLQTGCRLGMSDVGYDANDPLHRNMQSGGSGDSIQATDLRLRETMP